MPRHPGAPNHSPGATPPQPTDPGTTVQPCTEPGPAARLSVLTFNIHGALGHGRLDLGAIADAITASRADVVLLEEVDRYRARTGVVDQTAWLARRLGMHSAYGANKLRAPARAGLPPAAIGNAILSRFPMQRRQPTRTCRTAPAWSCAACCTPASTSGGRSVSVYVTHLQHTSGSMRIEQAHAIRRVIDADPLPKILGGDLNAEPGSAALRVLEGGGLHDTWAAVGQRRRPDRAGVRAAPPDRLSCCTTTPSDRWPRRCCARGSRTTGRCGPTSRFPRLLRADPAVPGVDR